MARTTCLMRWEERKFKCVCQVKPFKITQAQDVAIKILNHEHNNHLLIKHHKRYKAWD